MVWNGFDNSFYEKGSNLCHKGTGSVKKAWRWDALAVGRACYFTVRTIAAGLNERAETGLVKNGNGRTAAVSKFLCFAFLAAFTALADKTHILLAHDKVTGFAGDSAFKDCACIDCQLHGGFSVHRKFTGKDDVAAEEGGG